MNDYYLIAEVQDVYDSDGTVIIKSFSDFSDRFFALDEVLIDFFDKVKNLEVEYSRKVDDLILLKFRRFDSVEDVLFLIGKKLYVTKDKLYKLPEFTYYIHDLINSEVYIHSTFFGKLIDVLKLPGNDLYIIKKDDGKEIMIPAVDKYFDFFDDSKKKLFLSEESKIFFEDEN